MTYLSKISKKKRQAALSIFGAGIVTAALVISGLLLFVPREYSSEIRLLVVQKYTLTDTYTAAKSAEKISQNLAAVVHTSSFFEEVVRTTWVDLSAIDNLPEEKKRDAWKKKLKTSVDSGTSIITLTGYDTDPENAERLVQSASTALLEHGANYHGAPDTVSLRVVDTALTSTYPTRPNFLVNGVIAGLAGMILAALVIFLRPSTAFTMQPLKDATVSGQPKQKKQPSVAAPVPQATPKAPVVAAVAVSEEPQVDLRALKRAEKQQLKQKKKLDQFQAQKLKRAEKNAHAVRKREAQEEIAAAKREAKTEKIAARQEKLELEQMRKDTEKQLKIQTAKEKQQKKVASATARTMAREKRAVERAEVRQDKKVQAAEKREAKRVAKMEAKREAAAKREAQLEAKKQVAVTLTDNPLEPNHTGQLHMEQVNEKAEYAVLDVMNFTTHIPKHAVFKSVTVEEHVQAIPLHHRPQLTQPAA